jgi:predicted metal-dependent peptidase
MNLSPEKRLERAVMQLLRDKRSSWLSGIIVYGKRELSTRVPTGATDGVNEVYNPDFITKLSEEQLKGLVLHENLHKAYSHLTIWRHLWEEDPQCANAAMDYVINGVITFDLEFGLPEGALISEEFHGMDTEAVFQILKKQRQQKPQQQKKSGGKGTGDGHGKQSGSGGDEVDNNGGSMDTHDWEEAQRNAAKDGGKAGERTREYIERALRQGEMAAKYAGQGGGMAERLGLLQPPKVDWRRVLAEFLTETIKGNDESTWRRPSRRGMAMDIYLPSRYTEQAGELVLAIDTSGSIGGEELGKMLAETASLCRSLNPLRLTLLYWDSHVAGVEEYSVGQYDTLVQSTKPRGGGGTDPACIKAWLDDNQRRPAAIVIMTDGYVSSWPTFDAPCLWAITVRNITAQSGRTVTMED